MSFVFNSTKRKLVAWAQWSQRRDDNGLGYPKRSIEGRLRDEGGILPQGQGHRHSPDYPLEEQVESTLQLLTKRHPLAAEAIKLEYLQPFPQDKKAKLMNLSRQQFRYVRDVGIAWVDGRL